MDNWKWKVENWRIVALSKEKALILQLGSSSFISIYAILKKEFILSKQLLKAGTSIGANVAEAQQAQSKADFISKISIALKEATETKYWIKLLRATDDLTQEETESILKDCVENEKILTSILKSSKK